jgi:hypothetical protein
MIRRLRKPELLIFVTLDNLFPLVWSKTQGIVMNYRVWSKWWARRTQAQVACRHNWSDNHAGMVLRHVVVHIRQQYLFPFPSAESTTEGSGRRYCGLAGDS